MTSRSLRICFAALTALTAFAPLSHSAAQRTIVILGSSTAAGSGASRYALSWAGRLEAAVAPLGFEVRNLSISGSTTADSLARFDRDVSPLNPGFVILATSIVNESSGNVVETFMANTILLIRKVEAIGAVPLLVPPYPNDGFSAAMHESVKEIYRRLAGEGVPTFDFLDAADDGNGHWLPGLGSSDGTHPTDAGHEVLFESIPFTTFDRLLQPVTPTSPRAFGSWTQASATSTDGDIEVRPRGGFGSWTVSLWVKASGNNVERTLAAIEGGDVEVRLAGEDLRILRRGSTLATAALRAGAGFRHVSLVYQSVSGVLRLFLDAVRQREVVIGAGAPLTALHIGGSDARPALNATGDSFGDILLYRAPLSGADIRAIFAGEPPWKSVEAWLPLTFSAARHDLNLAATNVTTVVNGTWSWSSEGVHPVRGERRR